MSTKPTDNEILADLLAQQRETPEEIVESLRHSVGIWRGHHGRLLPEVDFPTLEAAADELERLLATTKRVRELHPREQMGERVVCGWCRDSWEEPWEWPCPTVRALDGEGAAR